MKSAASTVGEYLKDLPADRREAIEAVREVILDRLPTGYVEEMGFGMITYVVPLAVYPDTYNRQPLMYVGLANQKHHMAIYLSAIYASPDQRSAFEAAYAATGKRYDCGKSCVRFRRLDDLPLSVIGDAVASLPLGRFVSLAKDATSR